MHVSVLTKSDWLASNKERVWVLILDSTDPQFGGWPSQTFCLLPPHLRVTRALQQIVLSIWSAGRPLYAKKNLVWDHCECLSNILGGHIWYAGTLLISFCLARFPLLAPYYFSVTISNEKSRCSFILNSFHLNLIVMTYCNAKIQ